MKFRRLFGVLLCLLLLQATTIHAAAAQDESVQHYNIMIVMDCSHSLTNPIGILSDPQGYRYDATAMFLDLLSESGNNVGAVVFNSTSSTTDCSDATMREGLRLDTGLLSIDSDKDKDQLVKRIRSIVPSGYTDIGTALLAAAEHLKGMEAQNGLESIIILFTDGATETPDKYHNLPDQPVYAQSLKNRDAAVELIREEGITLCGVYLRRSNADLENNEVLRLVREANGFDSSATKNQVGDLFIHVQEADSLADAFQRFYTLVSGTGASTFEGKKSFRIPGTGIDEVNISVSIRGETLEKCREDLDKLKVTLVRPGNIVYSPQELAAITSLGSNYAVYKIQNPDAGPWEVMVECPGAEIHSSILFNISVSADVSCSVAADEIQINKPFTATARLMRNGKPLEDADDYQEYSCTLLVQDAKTQKEWPVEMFYDQSANAYIGQLFVQEYGEYYVHAEFACGDSVRILTPIQYWNIKNARPESPEVQEIPITLNLLSHGTAELDLRTLVTDKEDDPEDITITVDTGSYPEEAWELNGSVLFIDGAIGEGGSVTAIFTDTAGAQTMTEIRINYTNNLIRDVTIIGAIVLAIVVLAAVITFKRWSDAQRGGSLPGVLRMTLPLNRSVPVPLTVVAQSCVQQNLYAVLKAHRSTLVDNAIDRRCSEEDVDLFLEEFRKVLSGVQITAVRGKKAGENICSLTGLPGSVGRVDLQKEDQTEILLPDCDVVIGLEYNRYQ